jgi:hypothetical protein
VNRENLIIGLDQLGKLMCALGENKVWTDFSLGLTKEEYESLQELILRQKQFNGWFTEGNVRLALSALGKQLNKENLEAWMSNYSHSSDPKRVGIIMAGNLPLVGFHDLLCVLLSGHKAICKLSSDDRTLLPAMMKQLENWLPELAEFVHFSVGPIGAIDAVIATGSDNSTRYFEQYFGKYPHIFRSSRTSVAILTGDETKEELEALGSDVFQYFGLGCRNVAHLLIHKAFNLNRFFEAIVGYGDLIHHHKYANNYDYNRTIFLLNKVPMLDNNFVLLRENDELFSPLAVVHYQYFSTQDEIEGFLAKHRNEIQAIVGKDYIPFGQAQCPALSDYADGVDTMAFLSSI